jgi:capsular exopolysaccharide synthesis family protein
MKLLPYLTIIWRRKWIIALTVAAVLAVTVVGLAIIEPTYRATATLRVMSPAQGSADWIDINTSYADRLINTYARIATSQPMLDKIAQSLGGAELPPITVSAVENTELIEVTVTSPDPAFAAKVANTAAHLIQTEQTLFQTELAGAAVAGLDAEIARLSEELAELRRVIQASADGEPDSNSAATLTAQLELKQDIYDQLVRQRIQLSVRGALLTSPITLIDPATPAAAPVSPQPIRDGALALLLGMLGGLGLAFLVEHFDQRLYTSKAMEQLVTAPTLGRIPLAPRNEPPVFLNGQSPMSEAYRQLRTNILFHENAANVRTILVTSAEQNEGKSTITANLALSMSYLGKRVIVVDGDLRRPTMHTLFNLPNTSGLTKVLIGSTNVDSALQKSSIPHISVLTSGPLPNQPADLLEPMVLRSILEELASRADLVLIDSTAFVPVADASIFAKTVDGVLLVMRRSRARQDQLQAACEMLASTKARLLGTVVNQVEASQIQYYSERTRLS